MASDQSDTNPLTFFENLILRDGMREERCSFSKYCEGWDEAHDLNFDPKTDTLSYWVYDVEGEEIHQSETFTEYLQSRLKEELSRAKDSIDITIGAETHYSTIKGIVIKMADKLHFMLNKIPDIYVYPKAKLVNSAIRDLFSHLILSYPSFSTEINKEILTVFNIDSPDKKDITKTFTWLLEPKDKSICELWGSLKENKYIDYSTSLATFKIAFNNESPVAPLKIKWIDTAYSRLTNRLTLFNLLDSLSKHGYIKVLTDNQNFLNTVKLVFADINGSEFDIKSLRSSRSSKRDKKRGPSERNKKLDEIISSLSK